MVLPLEPFSLVLALIGELSDLVVVVSRELVHSQLVLLVEVLDKVSMLLVFAGLQLLESLDFLLEHLGLTNQRVLVVNMLVGILVNLHARLSDVRLQLIALVLGVTK